MRIIAENTDRNTDCTISGAGLLALVISIGWLLACLYTLVSLAKPLPPFRSRLQTLLLGIPAMVVSLFLVAVVSVALDLDLNAEKPKPNFKAPEKHVSEDWQKAGFPWEAPYEHAKSIGLTRYAAYKLLRDADAIAEYCDWYDRSWAITKQADKKFGQDPTGDQWVKRDGWERQKQDQLNREKLAKLGVDFPESQLLAKHGSWRIHCAAKKVGWLTVGLENAEAVTDKQADTIKDAIQLHYILRLERGQGSYFNNRKYRVPSCQRKLVGKLHVIGCRLMALGLRSDYDFFVAARTKDGKLAAASIEHNRHLSEFGNTKAYTPDGDPVHLARIATPRFDRSHPSFSLADINAAFGVNR